MRSSLNQLAVLQRSVGRPPLRSRGSARQVSRQHGHVDNMLIGWEHAEDDPAPPRPGRAPPEAQGARRPGGALPFRLPPPGGAPGRRAADASRTASPARPAYRRQAARFPSQGREGGAAGVVIVVDASAILEVLLNTPAGIRVSERLFIPGETLHAPHLLDRAAQGLRRYARAREL